MWSGSTGVPALRSLKFPEYNAKLKDGYNTDNRLSKTKIKCLGQQKAKSLSLEADHHLLFRNTLDSSQVMLTKKKSCAKSAVELSAPQSKIATYSAT